MPLTQEPATPQPPRESLLSLLAQWRAQTLEESQALQAQNWTAVRACQQAKQALQVRLLAASARPAVSTDTQLRPLIDELLALEARNRDWLADRQAALSNRRLELSESARNLHRLRRSYARQDQAGWQSYG
jgi:hypothetical protein